MILCVPSPSCLGLNLDTGALKLNSARTKMLFCPGAICVMLWLSGLCNGNIASPDVTGPQPEVAVPFSSFQPC